MLAATLLISLFFSSLDLAPAPTVVPPAYYAYIVPLPPGETAGGAGSLWKTELWVANTADEQVALHPLPCYSAGTFCSDPLLVPAQTTMQVTPQMLAGRGRSILVPTWHLDDVTFTLRVRDASRFPDAEGTEIPVIDPRRRRGDTIHLTNIPAGPEFRIALRLYALRAVATFRLRLYEVVEGISDRPVAEEELTLRAPPPVPPNMIDSNLAEAIVTELFDRARGAEKLRLEITPLDNPAPAYWAFVAATHTPSGHLTTITP